MNINGMEVTDVIVFPVRNKAKDSKVSAFAKVILNDQFIISGLKVVEGKNGPFLSFPSEYNKNDNKRYDICYPTTKELRTYISEQVLSQYSMTMSAAEALVA